ncbi:hypothetical protein N7492_001017 [Penicillium capsulatum]|uniref:Cryptic loci regulator 2 N-terminal domain-containing protein n=1 Tax=Penicillium capsulatum TaxID=69766 RepID=A0A9W9LZ20_9EURO|nr:hypothetical protein N7492_001017 [Penicillium capsulatum]
MSGLGSFEDPPQVVISVDDGLSDGDEKTWPETGKATKWDWQAFPDAKWRKTLAELWVTELGSFQSGKEYILEKLPRGFCLFDRARGTDPKFRDKFLYGHPSGFTYQTPKLFLPHLHWLMTGRVKPCECSPCLRVIKGRLPQKRRTKAEMQSSRGEGSSRKGKGRSDDDDDDDSRRKGKGKAKADDDDEIIGQLPHPTNSKGEKIPIEWNDDWPMTEHGPDYWKIHMMKMKAEGKIDIQIEHHFNFDWHFSHELLETYFTRLTLEPSFIPRKGELVLWVFEMKGELAYHPESQTYQMRSEDGTWLGMPDWRAGVVSQTPEEKCSYMDIYRTTTKKNPCVTSHGFRIETLPDPIGDDKSYSCQYRYVPLKCIRPFNAYERFIHGSARESWHPSIEHALTVMSSFATVANTRFVGTWPDARIHCRGIWVGAELLAVKDTIRLKPFGLEVEDTVRNNLVYKPDPDPVDVMTIDKIALNLQGCKEDPKDPQLADGISALVAGKVYTRDPNRLSRHNPFGNNEPLRELTPEECDAAFNQLHMRDYGPWYVMLGGRNGAVSHTMILGRCYEPIANDCFFDTRRLDYDIHSVLNARKYSEQVDLRMPEGIRWFWGDNRTEILGLAEMNGLEIWSGRPYTKKDWDTAGLPSSGKTSTKNSAFKALCKTSNLVRTGLGATSSSDEENSEKDLSERELRKSIPFREESSESESEEEEFDEAAANASLLEELPKIRSP